MFERIPFSGNAIDRLDALRDDDAALASLHADPTSRYLPFSDGRAWIDLDGSPRLAWLPGEALGAHTGEPLLLGRLDGAARFALAVDAVPGEPSSGKFIDARSIAAVPMPASDRARCYGQLTRWLGGTHHTGQRIAPMLWREALGGFR